MASQLSRPLSKLLLLALIFLLVPPIWWIAGDVVMLGQTQGSPRFQEARAIIHSDLDRGVTRALSTDLLFATAGGRQGGPPIEASLNFVPNLARQLPTCSQGGGRPAKADADAGGQERESSWRDAAIRDAMYFVVHERISTSRLALLSACVNSTPLAGRCARTFIDDDGKVSQAVLITKLVQLGHVHTVGGSLCWPPRT